MESLDASPDFKRDRRRHRREEMHGALAAVKVTNLVQ
jgi:hypothetical protein